MSVYDIFLHLQLAELLLESPDRLLHINASEYSQPLSLSRLVRVTTPTRCV
jgi:ATP-dependent Clp protease ATP-binding subunit ClpA